MTPPHQHNMTAMHPILKALTTSVAAIILLTGCHTEHEAAKAAPRFAVTHPLSKDVEATKEYVSQVKAIQHIELRALEHGYLHDIFVDEGKPVKKGQKLFQIMPQILQAEVKKAQAEAQYAHLEYKNTKLLADGKIVSANELALAKAKSRKAKAELDLAQVHRNLTVIRAPFDGIMGRLRVRKGSLLEEGELLSTLSDNSTMWVYFNVAEAEYLDYVAQPEADRITDVKLAMANHRIFPGAGKVETIEADFNNETGNIAFRATFANPKGTLRHGGTGKILMPVPMKNALIIPQKATYDILDKKFVFVVDDKNVAHSREVTIRAELPQVYIVGEGLTATDRVVLEGIRKLRDGMVVEVDEQDPADVLSHLEAPAQ